MGNYKYEDQLTSARLTTRFLTVEDILPWSKFFDDKEATRYYFFLGDRTSLEIATDWVYKQIDRYAEQRFGHQALIDKNTGEMIGQCGMLLQDVNGEMRIEIGYHVFQKHWGKGYAPEAVKLFIDYAFENNVTDTLISIIDINNLKSQRVADKNGLIRSEQIRWHNTDVFIYRIDKQT